MSEDPAGRAAPEAAGAEPPSASGAPGDAEERQPRLDQQPARSYPPSTYPPSTPSAPPQGPRLHVADPTVDRVWIPRDARPTLSMIRDIFLEHPDWRGVIGYDEFRRTVCKRAPAPYEEHGGDAWSKEDTSETRCWILDKLRANVSGELVYEAASLVARRYSTYNSLAEELRSFVWDGVPRIDEWTTTYLGAEDNPYHRDVGRRWLLSAVARGLAPGCKADHVLVLEAPLGGERKSSVLEALAGVSRSGHSYFNSSQIDLSSTFFPAQLVGTWIYEIPELVMFKAFGSERTKGFLSERIDRYSEKNEKMKIEQPRTCVFAATTNKERYLDDPNGRRTWPTRVGARTALELIVRDREQIFAECVSVLLPELVAPPRRGWRPYFNEFELPDEKRWWLDRAGDVRAREEQEMRYAADPWEEPVSAWMDANYHALFGFYDGDVWYQGRGYTTVSEVLESALKLKPAAWRKQDEMRVAEILTLRFGWRAGKRRRGPSGGRCYPFYLPADRAAESERRAMESRARAEAAAAAAAPRTPEVAEAASTAPAAGPVDPSDATDGSTGPDGAGGGGGR